MEAWKEALSVDPQSQKAREGVRMAPLLLGDFDAAASTGPSEVADVTADGAEAVAAELPAEEVEAQLDLGVARVKQLMAERRFAEAIEGAQGLLPLGPDSAELQNLLEEAQHGLESTPFIEEHLTLARELLTQERFAEAEAECKRVFTLDAGHPGGKALLKEIRDKIQESLKAAASQLGGMTVKLTMPQATATGARPRPPAPGPPPSKPPPEETPAGAAEIPEIYAGPGPGDEELLSPAERVEPTIPESGDKAKLQEEVAARAALDAAFEDQALAGAAAEESPFELDDGGVRSSAPAASPAAPPPTKAVPQRETIVEAKTIRPPSSRVVPAGPAPETAPAGSPTAVSPAAPPSPAVVAPPPIVAGQAKKAPVAPEAKPAPPVAKGPPGSPAAAAPKGAPSAPVKAGQPARAGGIPVAELKDHDETAAWETELAQLNLKDRERGMLRGTGAKATAAPVDQGEVDLMSLLDTGAMPGLPASGAEKAAAHPPSVPLAQGKETSKPPESGAEAARSKRPTKGPVEAVVPSEVPAAGTRPRSSERTRRAAAAQEPRSLPRKSPLLFVLRPSGGRAASASLYPAP